MKTRLAQVHSIFILDAEQQKAGRALAGLTWMQDPDKRRVTHFSQSDSFADLTEKDFHCMVFLGHANRQFYGKYHASHWVKEFTHQFKETKLNRACVRDICLMGCEVGLINQDGSSFAQEIAQRLHKEKFNNARVRAIASPIALPHKAGMVIEVIAQAGTGAMLGAHEGYFNAYLLDATENTELEKALAHGKNPNEAIDVATKNNPVYFLHYANPVTKLAWAENLFPPNENAKQRLKRLEADIGYQKRRQQSAFKMEALAAINTRITQIEMKIYSKRKEKARLLAGKKVNRIKKMAPNKIVHSLEERILREKRLSRLAENLKLLAIAVEHSPPAHCQTTILFNLPRFHTLFFRERNSTTYNLLVELSERELQTSPEPEKRLVVNCVNDDESTSIETTAPDPTAVLGAERKQRANAVAVKYHLGGDEQFDKALREINTLITALTNEIEQLTKPCYSFLHRYEIHTKTIKILALQKLKGTAANYADLERNAKNIRAKGDSRTFNGLKKNLNAQGNWVKNRTGILINKIADGPHNFTESLALDTNKYDIVCIM